MERRQKVNPHKNNSNGGGGTAAVREVASSSWSSCSVNLPFLCALSSEKCSAAATDNETQTAEREREIAEEKGLEELFASALQVQNALNVCLWQVRTN